MEDEKAELIREIIQRMQGVVSTNALHLYHQKLKLKRVKQLHERLEEIIRRQGR
jgi:hypothetical protein